MLFLILSQTIFLNMKKKPSWQHWTTMSKLCFRNAWFYAQMRPTASWGAKEAFAIAISNTVDDDDAGTIFWCIETNLISGRETWNSPEAFTAFKNTNLKICAN